MPAALKVSQIALEARPVEFVAPRSPEQRGTERVEGARGVRDGASLGADLGHAAASLERFGRERAGP